MNTRRLAFAAAGYALAGYAGVKWATERRMRRDLDELLTESETERLQLRAWYERSHPVGRAQRAARQVARHLSVVVEGGEQS